MTNGKTYEINKQLNSEEDFDALQETYAELEQAEGEADKYHDAWHKAEAKVVELEAKLAKAFEALCLADAALSGANMNTLSMRVVEKSVKSTLAELKGQDDENMHR
jgi:hypothetical protein